jgi:hypothetical protein
MKSAMPEPSGLLKALVIACGLLAATPLSSLAGTPKLTIKTKNGSRLEEQKKHQLERLAQLYDLKKWTVTREIVVEEGVQSHSTPVLTLNCRFLNDDDLALSAYLHEQGHWVLMRHQRVEMRRLFDDLERLVPGLPTQYPQGSGHERDTYFHLAVIMLEWQGLEELLGADRARRVMDFKKGDHYTAIYSAVLDNRNRLQMLLQRYRIGF